jgi:hypothetical protein
MESGYQGRNRQEAFTVSHPVEVDEMVVDQRLEVAVEGWNVLAVEAGSDVGVVQTLE